MDQKHENFANYFRSYDTVHMSKEGKEEFADALKTYLVMMISHQYLQYITGCIFKNWK